MPHIRWRPTARNLHNLSETAGEGNAGLPPASHAYDTAAVLANATSHTETWQWIELYGMWWSTPQLGVARGTSGKSCSPVTLQCLMRRE